MVNPQNLCGKAGHGSTCLKFQSGGQKQAPVRPVSLVGQQASPTQQAPSQWESLSQQNKGEWAHRLASHLPRANTHTPHESVHTDMNQCTHMHPQIYTHKHMHTHMQSLSRAWWLTPIIPTLVKLRQEDYSKFEASLGYQVTFGQFETQSETSSQEERNQKFTVLFL